MSFVIERLSSQQARTEFTCGVQALDEYFRRQVTQDIRRRVTACFVARDEVSGLVAGFYTLAASAILFGDLPEALAKRLPRYPLVPAARLGRLAVDQRYQGQGLGAALLWDAAERAARSELMAFALVVDAKDEAAAAFYRHHGFQDISQRPAQLMLPLARIKV